MTDLERAREVVHNSGFVAHGILGVIPAIAAALAAARREGAEEMRERAAQTMDDEFGDELAAAAIRALPLEAKE